MRRIWVCSAVFLAVAFLCTMFVRADGEKAKFTIEQVMDKVHKKPNLAKKLTDGSISEEEKKTLIEYYEELPKNTPPKGSAEDWKKRTETLLATAKAATTGGAAERASYRKAVNCKSCHDAHKAED